METSRETDHEIVTPTSGFRASNDNLRSQLSFGRSLFPADAVARIFKPSRSLTTSGTARTKGWRLLFERRRAPFIEPLMGYTGGDDTLTQVELEFPTLESAIRYAERQGLSYVVQRRVAKPANGPDGRWSNDRSGRLMPSPTRRWSGSAFRHFRTAMIRRSTARQPLMSRRDQKAGPHRWMLSPTARCRSKPNARS